MNDPTEPEKSDLKSQDAGHGGRSPEGTVTPNASPVADDPEAVLYNLDRHRAFLYPGGAPNGIFEWHPLYRLTHMCDVFVFTDCAHLEEGVNNIATRTPVGNSLRCDRVVHLPGDTVLGKGIVAELTRTVGSVRRKLYLAALAGKWKQIYRKLFWGRSPIFICVKALQGFDRRFDEIATGQNSPIFLVDVRGRPFYGMWSHLWQNYPGWDAPTWSCFKDTFEGLKVSAFQTEARRVVVRKGALNTDEIDADAVLTAGRFMHRSNVVMNISTTEPMAGVLSKLEDVCRHHRIDRVACVPFGYEDEGVVLDEWRRQSGVPLKLDIYCETRGDVVAFDGCVDELPRPRRA